MAAAACRTATLALVLLSLSLSSTSAASLLRCTSTGRPLPGIDHAAVHTASEEPGCPGHGPRGNVFDDAHQEEDEDLAGARGSPALTGPRQEAPLAEYARRDLHQIQSLHRRITMGKHRKPHHCFARPPKHRRRQTALARHLATTLRSGTTQGYGQYLADVFVGTPPRRFSLVLDTGSDLNWLQCLPCDDCFAQRGPPYDPARSSSYRPVPCTDPLCSIDTSIDHPGLPCRSASQTCSYSYWYGKGESNTTGDLAVETFALGVGDGVAAQRVDDVVFGCGHRNRGLFTAAAGLLGLGRGPLSFPSKLRPLYGGVFSYCLVGWRSNLSVAGGLVFGEDPALMSRRDLNFTSFVSGAGDTFYYVGVRGIKVAGELLDVPPETWALSPDGRGGAIVDSGTTLSHFAGPAYQAIRDALARKVKDYPAAAAPANFPDLGPCYDVSGAGNAGLPGFAIVFADGAEWNFPPENFFIRPWEAEEVVCLAVRDASQLGFSMVLGNFQQQNFHVVYDADGSRLGFAPERCTSQLSERFA